MLKSSAKGGPWLLCHDCGFAKVPSSLGGPVWISIRPAFRLSPLRPFQGFGGNVAVELAAQLEEFFDGAFALGEVLNFCKRAIGGHGRVDGFAAYLD